MTKFGVTLYVGRLIREYLWMPIKTLYSTNTILYGLNPLGYNRQFVKENERHFPDIYKYYYYHRKKSPSPLTFRCRRMCKSSPTLSRCQSRTTSCCRRYVQSWRTILLRSGCERSACEQRWSHVRADRSSRWPPCRSSWLLPFRCACGISNFSIRPSSNS